MRVYYIMILSIQILSYIFSPAFCECIVYADRVGTDHLYWKSYRKEK